MRYRQTFSVRYDIEVLQTHNVFAPDNHDLATVMPPAATGRSRALVYIDAGVAEADPGLAERIADWFTVHAEQGLELAALPSLVHGGEVLKNELRIIDRVGADVARTHCCRHSYIVIIGGGAVLDAVGCAASLVHRGLRQIRLPTTVLAQDDAGLGVKNGLNRFGNKNFYGTFTPPWAIVNDSRFLTLLDERGWRSGCAEAFKVALIKDATFCSWLIAHAEDLAARDLGCMEELVSRCGQLHLEHIASAGDPFEQGSSRPLDFGHWSAHRLEILSQHELDHGEAVAIGIALDAWYAAAIGRLEPRFVELYCEALAQLGFRLWHPALDLREADGRRSVLLGLEQFREHLGGELTLAMPDGIGAQRDIHRVDEAVMRGAFDSLRACWQRCRTRVTSP